MKKVLAALLAMTLVLGVTACGSSDESEEKKDKASSAAATDSSDDNGSVESGSEQSWGNFTVFVPEGFELKGGDVFDETDPRYFSVKKGEFYYFDFFTSDVEDDVMSKYDYNKNTYTNEQVDVEGTYNGIQWTGFQYSDGFGGYGFEAYTSIDGTYVKVGSAGFEFTSTEAETILGSLKVSAASDEPTTEEGSAVDADGSSATADESSQAVEDTVDFETTVEMKGAKVNLPAGYTLLKDAAPIQYVVTNDETGGMIKFWAGSDTADDALDHSKGDEFSSEDLDVDGVAWRYYIPYENAIIAAANTTEGYIMIDIDYGTIEEVEELASYIEFEEAVE